MRQTLLTKKTRPFRLIFYCLLLSSLIAAYVPVLKILTLPLIVFPGFALLMLLSQGKLFGWSRSLVGVFSLVVGLSQVGVILFLNSRLINIQPTTNIWSIIFLNLLYMSALVAAFLRNGMKLPGDNLFGRKFNLLKLTAVLVPVVIFIISWLVYPFFPGDDTYAYNFTLNLSIENRQVIQLFLARRPAFTPLLVGLHDLTGLSTQALLSWFLPLATSLSASLLPLYLAWRRPKIKWHQLLVSLIFIGSPYLIYQMQYSAPQIMIILLTFPVVLLATEAIRNNSKTLGVLSLLLAVASTFFHELGFVLLLLVGTAALVMYYYSLRSNFIRTLKRTGVLLVILFPYFLLLNPSVQIAKFNWIIQVVTNNLRQGLRWEWWYVDYYKGPDGIVFSYPGLIGLFWYFYLGLSILIGSLILTAVFRTNIRKTLPFILPSIGLTVLFFFGAELLPRLAETTFLPERAWPFLVIGLSTFVTILAASVSEKVSSPVLTIIGAIIITSGLIGFLVTASNRGILLSRSERQVVEYLENTAPKNSVIFSNQQHSVGVAHYTSKRFAYFVLDRPEDLKKEIEEELSSRDLRNFFTTRIITVNDEAGNQIERRSEQIAKGDQIDQLQYFAEGDEPAVYYYYSTYRFEKIGFVGSPRYLLNNAYDQRSQVPLLYGAESLIKDPNIVLLRIR